MGGANNDAEGRVILRPHEGKVLLTDVQVQGRAPTPARGRGGAGRGGAGRLPGSRQPCSGARAGEGPAAAHPRSARFLRDTACPLAPRHHTPSRPALSLSQVTDSGEVVVKGRKPPFRLLVRAKRRGGGPLQVLPAVSEGFVVATRRVKGETKADIPLMNEHVSKISRVGKETCKKLANLREAAQSVSRLAGVPAHAPAPRPCRRPLRAPRCT
jgi:hypothetical protein